MSRTIAYPRPCSKCGEVLPEEDFSMRDRGRRRAHCKSCHNLYKKDYHKRNPDKYENHVRISAQCRKVRLYGIDDVGFATMVVNQGGMCAICKDEFLKGKVHIDHDHTTGQTRSLLCFDCNTGLGKFKENTTIMKNAIAYLGRYLGESDCR